jgi:TPR repeat protein
MSAPVKDDPDSGERDRASMYAPPWERDAVDAAPGVDAGLRRVFPTAAHLQDPAAHGREPTPFEGDAAIHASRRPLDPVAVPGPPSRGSRRSILPFVAWILVAAAAATVVAAVAGVRAPEWLRGVEERTKAFGSRMFGTSVTLTAPKLADHGVARVLDLPLPPPARVGARTQAVPPVVATLPQVAERAALPALSSLEREEIAALYARGEQLIAQGEIAAARLVFARGAEAGDARSALALGASYDPEVLRKLGVLGVRGDVALAREWYVKAAGFGSREAAQRIELLGRGP